MQRQNIKGGKIRRELLSTIKSRINTGEDRQSIFNDLSAKYVERDWLASFIAGMPNPEDLHKIKKANTFIFLSLCIYAVVHIASNILNLSPMIAENKKLLFVLPMTFFWPSIAIWCAVQVRRYHGSWYRVAGGFSIIIICNHARVFFEKSQDFEFSLIIPGIVILMLAASSIMAFRIGKTYFPHFGFWGLKKENGVYVLSRS